MFANMEEIIKNTKEEIVLEMNELQKTINEKVYEFATKYNLMILHTCELPENEICCKYKMHAWEKGPILNPSGNREIVRRLISYAGDDQMSIKFRELNEWIQQELKSLSNKHSAYVWIVGEMKDDGVFDILFWSAK